MTAMQKFLIVHDNGTTKTIRAKTIKDAWNDDSILPSEWEFYTITPKN